MLFVWLYKDGYLYGLYKDGCTFNSDSSIPRPPSCVCMHPCKVVLHRATHPQHNKSHHTSCSTPQAHLTNHSTPLHTTPHQHHLHAVPHKQMLTGSATYTTSSPPIASTSTASTTTVCNTPTPMGNTPTPCTHGHAACPHTPHSHYGRKVYIWMEGCGLGNVWCRYYVLCGGYYVVGVKVLLVVPCVLL